MDIQIVPLNVEKTCVWLQKHNKHSQIWSLKIHI